MMKSELLFRVYLQFIFVPRIWICKKALQNFLSIWILYIYIYILYYIYIYFGQKKQIVLRIKYHPTELRKFTMWTFKFICVSLKTLLLWKNDLYSAFGEPYYLQEQMPFLWRIQCLTHLLRDLSRQVYDFSARGINQDIKIMILLSHVIFHFWIKDFPIRFFPMQSYFYRKFQ